MRKVMLGALMLGSVAGAQEAQSVQGWEYGFLSLSWDLAQFDSAEQRLVHKKAADLAGALGCPAATTVNEKTLFQCLGAQGWEFTGYVNPVDSSTKTYYFQRPLR